VRLLISPTQEETGPPAHTHTHTHTLFSASGSILVANLVFPWQKMFTYGTYLVPAIVHFF